MSEDPAERLYARHFTAEQANALLPKLTELLEQLREARDQLTDSEAHELLSDSAPGNGGGEAATQVGVAFLEVRRLLATLEESGIVLRDLERGLVDFPAMVEGREAYLCWELGEEEVAFWHELSSGYGGRKPLD